MPTALTIRCINPPAYSRPPRITLPNLGEFYQVLDTITSIPDPIDIIAKFTDKLNLALAPIRKYLQLVQGIMAIKQCVEAIPRAIMFISPTPIIDCIKALVRALAPIIQDIPPIPYVQAMRDICSFGIEVIKAVLSTLIKLDAKITRLLTLSAYAQALGDLELVRMSGCSMKAIGLTMQQLLDLLKVLTPITNLLLGALLKLIPTPQAQRAADDMLEAALAFDTAQEQLASIDVSVVGFPDLSGMANAMLVVHNALVTIHNAVSPWIGEAADAQTMSGPIEFVNF